MTRKVAVACAAALSLAAAGGARAEDWIVSVGAKVSMAPPYEGANHYVTLPTPTLSIRAADKPYRFTPPDGGTTLSLIDTRYVVFGPMVRFQLGRGDHGQLTGLDRIGWAAEPGAFLDLYPFRWFRLHGELRRGVIGHGGLVSDVGADLIYQSPRWDLSVGPRMGFGDKAYFEKYFGVTALDAARSPYIDTTYDPDGGRRYTGVEVGAAYHVTPRFYFTGGVGYHQLSDKAADSPIIAVAGSRNQYTATLGFTWTFGARL